MDKSTIGGIILALAGILAGLIIEGGKISQVLQPTAAMIVLGGTIGAVMIQFPLSVVLGAAKGLINVFLDRAQEPNSLIKELVGYANKARKDGIVSLDGQLATITGSVPQESADARHRRRRTRGVAQDDGTGARQSGRAWREALASI